MVFPLDVSFVVRFRTHLIAILFVFKWFQRWFISSRRRCSMTASSCDVNELNNFLPVPSRRSYTTRWVSISDCKSCKMGENIIIFRVSLNNKEEIYMQRGEGGVFTRFSLHLNILITFASNIKTSTVSLTKKKQKKLHKI